MGGSIKFSKKTSWVTPGWLYRFVVREVCDVLAQTGASHDLQRDLSTTLIEGQLEFVDVQAWPFEKREAFCQAARAACKQIRVRGAVALQAKEFFPGVLAGLNELDALLTSAQSGKKG
jgi:hypothetical protein